MKPRNRAAHNRGSVLIEAALTLPLCLLFATGVLYIGQTLAQVVWFAQTAYQGAFIVGDSSASVRDKKFTDFQSSILPLENSAFRKTPFSNISLSYTSDTPSKQIAVTISGTLDMSLFGNLLSIMKWKSSFPISYSITGPLLVSNDLSNIDGNFHNPTTLQNCKPGTVDSGVSPDSCVLCESDNNCDGSLL